MASVSNVNELPCRIVLYFDGFPVSSTVHVSGEVGNTTLIGGLLSSSIEIALRHQHTWINLEATCEFVPLSPKPPRSVDKNWCQHSSPQILAVLEGVLTGAHHRRAPLLNPEPHRSHTLSVRAAAWGRRRYGGDTRVARRGVAFLYQREV